MSIIKAQIAKDAPMNTALQRPKRPPVVLDEYFTLLDNLQKTGAVNMFGAAPHLREIFPELSRREARDVVLYWMETFSDRKGA